jgi:hypothetical protein
MLFLLRHWHPRGSTCHSANRGGRLPKILPTSPSTIGRCRPIGVRKLEWWLGGPRDGAVGESRMRESRRGIRWP